MSENRNRAWRRFKDYVNNRNGMGSGTYDKPEKKWKFLYTRKSKLARAKQLGFEYPRKNVRQLLEQETRSDD